MPALVLPMSTRVSHCLQRRHSKDRPKPVYTFSAENETRAENVILFSAETETKTKLVNHFRPKTKPKTKVIIFIDYTSVVRSIHTMLLTANELSQSDTVQVL